MGQPSGGGADTAAPLITGTFTGTGQSANAAFYIFFNVSLWGTFAATVNLERSFDGGTTWLPVSATMAGPGLSWTVPASVIVSEPEHQVLYRLNCTAYTSGTVNYRMSQATDIGFTGGLGR